MISLKFKTNSDMKNETSILPQNEAMPYDALLCAAEFKRMLIERVKGSNPKTLRDIRIASKKLYRELGLDSGSTEWTGKEHAEILVVMPTIRFDITLEDVV